MINFCESKSFTYRLKYNSIETTLKCAQFYTDSKNTILISRINNLLLISMPKHDLAITI